MGLQTNDSWQCRESGDYSFDSYFSANAYIGAYGNCDYRLRCRDWKPAAHQYDDKPFVHGGLADIWNLKPRTIPQMLRGKMGELVGISG